MDLTFQYDAKKTHGVGITEISIKKSIKSNLTSVKKSFIRPLKWRKKSIARPFASRKINYKDLLYGKK